MKTFSEYAETPITEEILTEASKGVSINDYVTKWAELVLKQVAKKLDKRLYEKTNVRVVRRGSSSMAFMEFSGYTRSDTEFSGRLEIIDRMPDGTTKVDLAIEGVNGSNTSEVARLKHADPFPVDDVVRAMNSAVEYAI